jgi:endogenous inhibitor of DNA gyrase (YacG/DUF329 family)
MTEKTIQEVIDFCNSHFYKNGKFVSVQARWLPEVWKEAISHYVPERYKTSGSKVWVLNNLPIPKCKMCGKDVGFADNGSGWSEYCSSSCSRIDPARSKKISSSKMSKSKEEKEVENKKREATLLEKYGVRFNSQRPDVKKEIGKKRSIETLNPSAFALLNDRDWLDTEYNKKCRSAVDIAEEVKVDYSTVLRFVDEVHGFDVRSSSNYSREELRLREFLDSINVEYKSNITGLIGGRKELDIFIPSISLGIEINGLYFHTLNQATDTLEARRAHINKTEGAKANGIELLHFTDAQIHRQFDIVKGIVSSRLGMNSKAFARKCEIVELSTKEEKAFLVDNHIQGFSASKVAYGLSLNGEVVSVMSFSKPRFTKNYEWEIVRFANKIGMSVTGAADKLFKHFIKNHSPCTVVSYSDRMLFNGKVYETLGFSLSKTTPPGYSWFKVDLYHRTKFQKKKLINESNYSEDKTESQIMFENGFRKYWDCGQLVFVWKA